MKTCEHTRGLALIAMFLANKDTLALDPEERDRLGELDQIEALAIEGDDKFEQARTARLQLQARILDRLVAGGRELATSVTASTEETELAEAAADWIEDAVFDGRVHEIWPDLLSAVSN